MSEPGLPPTMNPIENVEGVTKDEVAAMDNIRRLFKWQRHETIAMLAFVRIMTKLETIERKIDRLTGGGDEP